MAVVTFPTEPVAPLGAASAISRRSQLWWRPLAVVVVVVVAYHRSLLSLLEGLNLDTPLAHLGLVPAMALLLCLVRRRDRDEPQIHDRQLDWIVAIPLLALAVGANVLLPVHLSTDYWTWRIDLLTLPLFVAGVTALLLGVRTLARVLPAVLFLLLAWPWPYNFALDRWLGRFTELTVSALSALMGLVEVATPVKGSGGLFVIQHGGSSIEMSVASACSGANGLVGFLLVGVALLTVVSGSRMRKMAWLAAGAVVVWSLNLARIIIVFTAARAWGGDVAMNGFHPYVGLVTFLVGMAAMLLLVRPFGLTLGRSQSGPEGDVAGSAGSSGPDRADHPAQPHRPPVRAAAVTALAGTLVLAAFNADLAGASAISTSLGAPRLGAFSVDGPVAAGWQVKRVTEYDWTKRFFGSDSTWTRFNYLNTGEGLLRSNLPVIADIVETSDRSALSAYGIEACYRFHDYEIVDQESADLGSGVVGRVVTYRKKPNATWTAVYWQWPIDVGGRRRYERVVLLFSDHEIAQIRVPDGATGTPDARLRIDDMLRGVTQNRVPARVRNAQRFLVAFGRDMVATRAQAPASPGGKA